MGKRPDISIDELIASAELFSQYVYTPLFDAVRELNDRWDNEVLERSVNDYTRDGIPEIFKNGFKAVLFRSLATPNFEFARFMCVPDSFELEPVILEVHKDKFSLNNPLKYQLAKMGIHQGFGKKGGIKIDYKKILDFNASHKKTMDEVSTLWGQSLLDFHHELLGALYPQGRDGLFDVSSWLHNGGRTAKEYYREVVSLFLRHGILFENFVLEGDELFFTKEIFLPAFFEAWDTTGYKPLVVALEPTEIEGDIFWSCYPAKVRSFIEAKKNGS